MQLAMVTATERDRELIAHLACKCYELREPQVVGIGGSTAADQARLLGDVPDVRSVADPPRFGMRQDALVYPGGL
jgi:hypothetical protein